MTERNRSARAMRPRRGRGGAMAGGAAGAHARLLERRRGAARGARTVGSSASSSDSGALLARGSFDLLAYPRAICSRAGSTALLDDILDLLRDHAAVIR